LFSLRRKGRAKSYFDVDDDVDVDIDDDIDDDLDIGVGRRMVMGKSDCVVIDIEDEVKQEQLKIPGISSCVADRINQTS
jgi:hypothetical protein